jgi:hypothetical protein
MPPPPIASAAATTTEPARTASTGAPPGAGGPPAAEANGLADASEDAGDRRERQGAAKPRARCLERRERPAARLALGEVRLELGRALRCVAVEVLGERSEPRAALRRELIEIDVRAAHGHAQPHARAGDDLRDGIGADPEVAADLGVRVALDLAQHQGAPLAPGQCSRAPSHETLLLPEIVVGTGGALDVAVRDLVLVTQLLPEDVAGGGMEVARDVHVRRRIREAGHEADEGLLQQVLGGVRIVRQAPAVAAQAGRVRLVERLEHARSDDRFVQLPCPLYRRHPRLPRHCRTGLATPSEPIPEVCAVNRYFG